MLEAVSPAEQGAEPRSQLLNFVVSFKAWGLKVGWAFRVRILDLWVQMGVSMSP